MNRRQFITSALTLVIFAALGASPSFAEDGSSSDGGSNEGGGSSDGGSSSDNGSSDSGSNEGGSSGGNQPSGGSENSAQGSHAFGGGQEGDSTTADTKDALPLSEMLNRFRSLGNNTLIDVILIGQGSRMKYRFKYIDAGGNVRKSYFNALTGEPTP